MDGVLQDLRFGLRALRLRPGFTAAAALVLALGIGASAAIFSLVDAVLLRPLPLPAPEQLAAVYQVHPSGRDTWWSPASYADLAREGRAFSGLAAWYPLRWNLRGDTGAERIAVGAVSDRFFEVLGLLPERGRGFEAGEDRSGHDQVAVVTAGFFRRALDGDPAALGRQLLLSEKSYTVVGVLPERFRFPGLAQAEVFVPIGFSEADLASRGSHYLRVVGRLAAGAALPQAQAELELLARRLAIRDPDHTGWSARVRGLQQDATGASARALHLLLAAVLLVLLIGCANVAGLLLARGVGRRREIAIRAALGGGRGRIARQLLVEAVLLALLGGALGLLLAGWAVDGLLGLAPRDLPRLDEVRLDGRAAGFALLLSLASGLACGVWPALRASRTDLLDALKGGLHAGAGLGRARARGALVVAEVALALVLAVGAGLMGRSLQQVLDRPLGFEPEGVLTAQVGLPFTRWTSGQPFSGFFARLVERVEALPGVTAAAATTAVPLDPTGSFGNGFQVEGQPPAPPGHGLSAELAWVTPGWARALGVPLIEGRQLDARDAAGATPAVLVNQAFVRAFLPGQALGQRLQIFNDRFGDGASGWRWTIVGVVGDTPRFSREDPAVPQIFLPLAQQAATSAILLVRTSGDPLRLAAAVRRELQQLDPGVPLSRVATLRQVLADAVAGRRSQALLLGLFGAAALLLAALGLHALIAHSVAQRTQEIGVRMALGARSGQVLALVLREGLLLTSAGVLLGAALALAGTRALQGALYGVSAADPSTYLGAGALLLVSAALASWLPARRAARVDPAVALRAE